MAKPCLDISKNKELAYEMTMKGNSVAIVCDGTRVLGLGNIGSEAALPVMEGKALYTPTYVNIFLEKVYLKKFVTQKRL